MAWWWSIGATLPFIALLLASGVWANSHFSRFDRLPAHFDASGKATRLAPRRVMAWLLPVLFSVVLTLVTLLAAFVPPQYRNGDPLVGALVGGFALLGAQAFVLWLTARWARTQQD